MGKRRELQELVLRDRLVSEYDASESDKIDSFKANWTTQVAYEVRKPKRRKLAAVARLPTATAPETLPEEEQECRQRRKVPSLEVQSTASGSGAGEPDSVGAPSMVKALKIRDLLNDDTPGP